MTGISRQKDETAWVNRIPGGTRGGSIEYDTGQTSDMGLVGPIQKPAVEGKQRWMRRNSTNLFGTLERARFLFRDALSRVQKIVLHTMGRNRS